MLLSSSFPSIYRNISPVNNSFIIHPSLLKQPASYLWYSVSATPHLLFITLEHAQLLVTWYPGVGVTANKMYSAVSGHTFSSAWTRWLSRSQVALFLKLSKYVNIEKHVIAGVQRCEQRYNIVAVLSRLIQLLLQNEIRWSGFFWFG